MQISTPRLLLRSFRSDDIKAFAELHADPDVMRYLGGVLSRDDAEKQLLDIMEIEAETGLVRFALEIVGAPELVGYCGLKPAGDWVDLSYVIGKQFWGRGYALEAAKCVREIGLTDLSITNMEAGGAAENTASIKILEQLLFENREELMFNNCPAIRFYD